MTKFVTTILGMLVFVVCTVTAVGAFMLYNEQNAYISARSEIIQQVKEAEPKNLRIGSLSSQSDSNLRNLDAQIKQSLGEVQEISLDFANGRAGDRDGDGVISHGDEVELTFKVFGRGGLNFVKKSSTAEKQKNNLPSGSPERHKNLRRPYFVSTKNITITNRNQ